jgi:soluble cytochrome b562
MDEETTFTQTEKFKELIDLCNEQLQFIQTHPAEREMRLSECKTVLKELESVLEHIEQEALMAGSGRKVKEATAKGYRNQYSQLVKAIMKADKAHPEEGTIKTGFRFTSDMISDNSKLEGQVASDLGTDYKSANLSPQNEEVQDMQRNFVLENKLVIGAAILLFLFLIAFLILVFRF